jgi:hypothetical protein
MEVVDTTQEHQRQLLRVRVDCVEDVLFPDNALAVAGMDLDDRIIRIETMKLHLGFKQVSIRRKHSAFADDLESAGRRSIERHEQQVQVCGQRVHADDFGFSRSDDAGHRRGQPLMVAVPGMCCFEVTLYTEPRPVCQLELDCVPRGSRLQTQGVPGKVHGMLPAKVRQMKAVPVYS